MVRVRFHRSLTLARLLPRVGGLCLLVSFAHAVPPVPGQARREGKTCFINSTAYASRVQALRGAPALAPPAKNYSVIVLRVQFTDKPFATDTATASQFFQNVQNYYKENSFDVFVPTFTLSPIIDLPRSEASYGQNCSGDVACKVPLLISESIAEAEPFVNFNDFDQVMIYHAGYGEEANGTDNELWSLFFPSSEMGYYGFSPIEGDGNAFDGATVVPERERGASALGVICHEYGHQIGLPDLYDTSVPGGQSTVGAWDLMDYPWTGNPVGSNPPHLGAWSKRFMGFGTTQALASTGTITLSPIEITPGKSFEVYRSGAEYFLVEYRLSSAAIFDNDLPQSAGLAVWHVDETVVNDPTTFDQNRVNSPNRFGHNGVDLVEANGGLGEGFTDGQSLSSPASDWFNGAVSSLVMSGISGVGGGTVSAQIFFMGAKTTQVVARAISYPNPSTGLVRAGAPSGTWSTLRLQLARPVNPSALKAVLYTMAGVRVREVPGSDFVFRFDLSRDYEWIYEYDWDGRDETRAEAASGVYHLHYTVDGEKIKKTLVVQR